MRTRPAHYARVSARILRAGSRLRVGRGGSSRSPRSPSTKQFTLGVFRYPQCHCVGWRDVPLDDFPHHVTQYPWRQRVEFDAVSLKGLGVAIAFAFRWASWQVELIDVCFGKSNPFNIRWRAIKPLAHLLKPAL